MKTQVNIKLDVDIKKKAQAQAKKLGLSLSSVVNATLSQFARSGTLELSTKKRMSPQLEKLVIEAHKEYKEGKTSGPFDNVDDLFEHLGV